MSGVSFAGVSIAEVRAALIGDEAPLSENPVADVGNTLKAQPMGHRHPRLTSTTIATVAAGSTVNVMFTRKFANRPGMVMTEFEGDNSASSQPAIFKVQSWIMDGADYAGAVIKVWRAQVIPQNLVNLLLGGIFNLFNAGVVGTQFSIIAVARSDV